ncbi:hypothetical protein MUO83_07815, partial [Candidatus Bathyarchaeota archaeon]|nr:hypothetical protein [Candidatus Bathyarchaeota archaeon]
MSWQDRHGRWHNEKGDFIGTGKMKDHYYVRMYHMGYYYAAHQKEYNERYINRNRKTVVEEYLGPCVCPRCELKGSAALRGYVNVKTGIHYVRQHLVVFHPRRAGRKASTCWIGTCPLGVSEN